MTPQPTQGDRSFDDPLAEELAALDEAAAHLSPAADLEKMADCLRLIERVRRDTPGLMADIRGPTPAGMQWLDGDGATPTHIGRFHIQERLGQGGFGLVFLAHDPQLERQVALKVPRIEVLVNEETRERFLREGKAAASLDHGNIATVYEAGSIGPICYIASEYCAGGTLANLLWSAGQASAGPPLKPTQAARLMKTLADAVGHAHERGVLHRDLKPANVLFSEEVDVERSLASEVDFERTARIVDFGLAKSVHAETSQTKSGAMLGTPAYMSPEQAGGNGQLIGPPSDVYSLGAILYELLAGYPPHRGDSDVDTLLSIKVDMPRSPRYFRRGIGRDLETICLKCLNKSPDGRYPTAQALADDMGRYLRGESIVARPTPVPVRAWRWCRRHPAAALAAAVVVLLAVFGPLVAFNQAGLHRAAQTAQEQTRQTLYISDMNLALQDWEEANLDRVGRLLARHLPQPGQQDLREFEWYYLSRLDRRSLATPSLKHESGVHCVATSPDGSTLAAGLADGSIALWDTHRRTQTRTLTGHLRAPVVTLSFSPDGSRLVSGCQDQTVRLWDVSTGSEVGQLEAVHFGVSSPDGERVAYLAESHTVGMWEPASDERKVFSQSHTDHVHDVAYSPDGLMLATASWDQTIKLWDASSGRLIDTLHGHRARVWCVAFSPDSELLASGDVNGTIKLWEVQNGIERITMPGHQGTILALTFQPQGKQLASAGTDNTVKLWNTNDGRVLTTLKGHTSDVSGVVFSPSTKALYSGGEDGIVRMWDASSLAGLDVLRHPGAVSCVQFSPDGNSLATTCWDGKIRSWDTSSGRLLHEIQAHGIGHAGLAYSADGARELLVSISGAGTLKLWDAQSWVVNRRIGIESRPDATTPVAVSSAANLLAWPQSDVLVRSLNLLTGEVARDYRTPESPRDLEFSPDGAWLAIAHGRKVDICSSERRQRVRRFKADGTRVEVVKFSPDGKSLVTGGVDRTLRVWDMADVLNAPGSDLAPRQEFKGHGGLITAVAYSPDGCTLASAGGDQAIRLWDQATGVQRGALKGHSDSIGSLAFSPAGDMLASAGADNSVRIWRAPQRE